MANEHKDRLREMHDYWDTRAPSYGTEDVFGRNILKAFLVKTHPNTMVEVGCGIGELFLTYKDVPHVDAIDWSEEMLKRANIRKQRHYLPNIKTWRHDICQCAPAGHWDVAITRTVLMHIPPDHVEKAIRHISKMADQFLIFEYYENVQSVALASHCWLHDYKALFEAAGCQLVEAYFRPDIPQVLFHFKRAQT